MRILILGTTGFIGHAIFNALVREHEIIAGSRSPLEAYPNWRKVDFNTSIDFEILLQDVEMVINAIGIPSGDFHKIQTEIPLQLFQFCKEKEIKIINISAVGAEKNQHLTEFLSSKKITDDFILSETDGKVIYPGIVLGEHAKSSQLFKELSGLPIVPLLGNKELPFVHITQLTETIKHTIIHYNGTPSQQFIVAKPQSLKDVLSALKDKKIKTIKIPLGIVSLLFKLFPNFSLGVFDRNMFILFKRINANDYKPLYETATVYLKENNIRPSNYILKLFTIVAIAFIWIWSGIISLYSWDESLKLMATIGITNQLAPVAIILGSVVDIILGIFVFISTYRSRILQLQILFITIYSLILTFFAFDFWLHPFGPIAKNIPLIVLTYLYYKWDKNYWL